MNQNTRFPTTQWSMVLETSPGESGSKSLDAREKFCRTYWKPLAAFIQSLGLSQQDAEDLTQEIFANIHSKDHYTNLNPEKGRMRGYLKTSAKYRVVEFHRKMTRQKRGGEDTPIELNEEQAQAAPNEPERQFDRQWALNLLDLTANEMEKEYEARERASWFQHLFPVITKEITQVTYADIAKKLDTTEGAVKLASHRMKEKYRNTLRSEVAKTVLSENEIDDEISSLFNALSAP